MGTMSTSDRVRLNRVEIWLISGTQDMTPVVRLFPQGAKITLGLHDNGHFYIPEEDS